LSGKEIFARQSSSYWEHLQQLNKRFASEGKKPIKLREAPEELSDSDLLQMVNAGLVEIVVVDNYQAELWAKILPEIRVHPDIAINSGGQIGVIMRPESPLLKEALNTFIENHKGGTTFGNTIINRYLGSTRFRQGHRSVSQIWQAIQPGPSAPDGAGLSGIAAGPTGTQPRRCRRNHAIAAVDRQGAESWQYQ